ncbi:hypothetical protein DM813_07055 [Pseudomonas alkylphenolica]|uniref:Uncharacterized protein n=2 Tax=Pseudomonas alkylphenolica TaxID=237609 RepID=A0A443ZWZ0_9PSED|nr:hypothetical protein DM813_07055 [Pseudomonas alkylphenolica]
MLRFYKRSRPKYWLAIYRNPLALHLLPCWVAVAGIIASLLCKKSLGPIGQTLCVCMFTWALFLAREYFAGQYFRDYYQRHAIADQPFLQRDSYLHYAHFLDALKQSGVEINQVKRMAEFGRISGHPVKPLNLMQNTVFVWLMTFGAALAVEKIKLTRLWKFQDGDLAMILALIAALLIVFVLQTVHGYRQHKGRLIRYLEWAEHDLNKT